MHAIGTSISVRVAPEPPPGETCEACGVDASHYVKHPRLIGGNCSTCGAIWLPALTFGNPQPITCDIRAS